MSDQNPSFEQQVVNLLQSNPDFKIAMEKVLKEEQEKVRLAEEKRKREELEALQLAEELEKQRKVCEERAKYSRGFAIYNSIKNLHFTHIMRCIRNLTEEQVSDLDFFVGDKSVFDLFSFSYGHTTSNCYTININDAFSFEQHCALVLLKYGDMNLTELQNKINPSRYGYSNSPSCLSNFFSNTMTQKIFTINGKTYEILKRTYDHNDRSRGKCCHFYSIVRWFGKL